MTGITEVPQWVFEIAGVPLTLNATTLLMTWIVMAALLAFSALVVRRLALDPGPVQQVAELLVGYFRDLVQDTLGLRAPRYFPLILALFTFILLSNWLGMVPLLEEPTRDLNTTLALAGLGFVVSHGAALRAKGWKRYTREYFQPFFLMFPLNVIGELAKVVSLSFRLYGNIMGGAIIILVVSQLVHHLVLPPLLNAFFGVFVGTVQAFVFAMLILTYISVAVQE